MGDVLAGVRSVGEVMLWTMMVSLGAGLESMGGRWRGEILER